MKNYFTLILSALLCSATAFCSPSSSPFSADFAQLRTNLYIIAPDGSRVLMDGTLTQFDSDYSNDLDGMDARKMSNFSENWGMLRNTTTLVIERRHSIQANDSIFFKMWNMRVITYQVEFVAAGLNQYGVQAELRDKFLQSSTAVGVNDTTRINFSVTSNAASKASDRFMLVFSAVPNASILPVTFVSAQARRQSNVVLISWNTMNEKNIKNYEVQRSANGIDFTDAASVNAQNLSNNNYNWTDNNAPKGNCFYRIQSTDANGKTALSTTMKINVAATVSTVKLYPNPLVGSSFNLSFSGQVEGSYTVRLINQYGQSVLSKTINIKASEQTENISLPASLSRGIYQVEINAPAGNKNTIQLVY